MKFYLETHTRHPLTPQPLGKLLGTEPSLPGQVRSLPRGGPRQTLLWVHCALSVPHCSRATDQSPGSHGCPWQRETHSHTDYSMVASREGRQGAASPTWVDASSWRQGRRRTPNLGAWQGGRDSNPSTLQGAQWNHHRLCSAEIWVQTLASRHLLTRDREQDAAPP